MSSILTAALRNAVVRVNRLASRIVVPVASIDEMSDPWRLYRLTPSADAVRARAARRPA